MHLLVLSAFRRQLLGASDRRSLGLNAPFGAQCFPTDRGVPENRFDHLSQCTFWCSVLSDTRHSSTSSGRAGLNAPFGAQCFPTPDSRAGTLEVSGSQCTFWCSVLSDSDGEPDGTPIGRSQCTFWCSVLSDSPAYAKSPKPSRSQCTFWCSVLSYKSRIPPRRRPSRVSMHLLVLSAFRPVGDALPVTFRLSLNAPFGAQCFPTCKRQRQ